MKTKKLSFIFFALFTAFLFQSCLKDNCERKTTYFKVTPIFKTAEEIHNGKIVNEAPRKLKNPGKIYFYNDFIFINERKEGVHVIDNSVPENPQNIAFVKIPGNDDIAIRGNILYASSYTDLLAIDISDFQNATLVNRVENVFPPIWEDLENNRILVEYEQEEITEVLDCETVNRLQRVGDIFLECVACDVLPLSFDATAVVNSNSYASTGIGGSMARFTILSDHLYVVDDTKLDIFDVSLPEQPSRANTVNLGWGIETIFPFGDKLFIGSNSGMFIFDNSDPVNPTQLSRFEHARACDPVFVKGTYAYVTLRDGNICEGFKNQLDLIDITDLIHPRLVKSFPMDHPFGLSIKANNLFLCEGDHGLKVFDVSYPPTLGDNLLDHLKGITTFDVIALPGDRNILLVIGEDGFYQYNFDDPSNLQLLSSIPVEK